MNDTDLDLDAIEKARRDSLDDQEMTYHERVSATIDLLGPDGYVADLIAEVRRLRADNEQGRMNLAHYRETYNDLAGLNARLSEALHEARVTIQASVGHYKPPPGYDDSAASE
jgi:hypothetical protein